MNLDYVIRQFGLTEPASVRKARAAAEYLFTEVNAEPGIPPAILAKAATVSSPEDAAKLATEARQALAGYGVPLQPLIGAAQDAISAAQYGAVADYRAEILRRLGAEVAGLLTRVGGMDQASAKGFGLTTQAKSDHLFATDEVRRVKDLFNALMFSLDVAPLGVLNHATGRPQNEPYSWFAALTDLTADKAGFGTACRLGGFAGQDPEHWHVFMRKASELDVTIKAADTVEEIMTRVEAWHEVSESHVWNSGRQELVPRAGVRPVPAEKINAAVAKSRRQEEVL
jgi:hypothetical protein